MESPVTRDAQTDAQTLAGKMFLYTQPELLSHEAHGSLGLTPLAKPFSFAANTRVLPLTLAEFKHAQMTYPIVFSDTTAPIPLAVVGGADEINLFVDEDGGWAEDCYIPAYARCYPFAVAAGVGDKLAVVIDRAAQAITESPEQAFFDGKSLHPNVQSMVDFSARYDAERRKTIEFCRQLNDLGLLTGHEATRSTDDGERVSIASYTAVDAQKLGKLGADTVNELFHAGYLASVFAHLFSLDNWDRLLQRAVSRSR